MLADRDPRGIFIGGGETEMAGGGVFRKLAPLEFRGKRCVFTERTPGHERRVLGRWVRRGRGQSGISFQVDGEEARTGRASNSAARGLPLTIGWLPALKWTPEVDEQRNVVLLVEPQREKKLYKLRGRSNGCPPKHTPDNPNRRFQGLREGEKFHSHAGYRAVYVT